MARCQIIPVSVKNTPLIPASALQGIFVFINRSWYFMFAFINFLGPRDFINGGGLLIQGGDYIYIYVRIYIYIYKLIKANIKYQEQLMRSPAPDIALFKLISARVLSSVGVFFTDTGTMFTICAYIYIHMHTCVCICTHVYIYIYIYTYTYMSLSLYMYICMYFLLLFLGTRPNSLSLNVRFAGGTPYLESQCRT